MNKGVITAWNVQNMKPVQKIFYISCVRNSKLGLSHASGPKSKKAVGKSLFVIYFYLEMFVESNLDDSLSTPTLDGDERPRRRSRTPIRQNPEEYLVGDEDFPMERKPTGISHG